MGAYELFKKYTKAELVAMTVVILEDPESYEGRRMTKKAARKFENLGWAIRWHQDKKERDGSNES